MHIKQDSQKEGALCSETHKVYDYFGKLISLLFYVISTMLPFLFVFSTCVCMYM